MKTQTDYYLHGFEEWDHGRICEETAWGIIERFGWVPSPMLVMWLTRMVGELEPERSEKIGKSVFG